MKNLAKTLNRANICTSFLATHVKKRAEIRNQSKNASPNLLTAHQFAFSAVISYQDRIQGLKFEASDDSTKGRMSLLAQFIQGIDITETAISEGLYANAANLLKQELEILAAIEEFEVNQRRDGRVPKFIGRVSNFGRRYGEFNDIAHPTKKEIVASLAEFSDGERYGATTIPKFNKNLYQILYGTQTMFLIILLNQMQCLFKKIIQVDWDKQEIQMATSALQILIKEGVLKEQTED